MQRPALQDTSQGFGPEKVPSSTRLVKKDELAIVP